MKNIILLLLSSYLLTFSACKKNSSAPSIIGTWAMSNVSGNYVNNASTAVDTTTYSFNPTTNTITGTGYSYHPNTNPPTVQYDTVTYQISSEAWTFNADGSYSISESYVQNANKSTTSVAYTSTGIWEYLSNTKNNNGFILTGAAPNLLSFNNNNVYAIQSLNNTTMVLTQISDQTGNSGSVNSTNFTITFTKQ